MPPPSVASASELAFAPVRPICITQPPKTPPPVSRRVFLRRLAPIVLLSALPLPLPTRAAPSRQWSPEELCPDCNGRGKQTCTLCTGSGTLVFDDSVIVQENVCPNCQGVGSIRCPACIGLGLANTNGILRNAARDGSLRMLRDGSYEILDCSAFPACDVHDAERRSQL